LKKLAQRGRFPGKGRGYLEATCICKKFLGDCTNQTEKSEELFERLGSKHQRERQEEKTRSTHGTGYVRRSGRKRVYFQYTSLQEITDSGRVVDFTGERRSLLAAKIQRKVVVAR
jgi:hypothetical protein